MSIYLLISEKVEACEDSISQPGSGTGGTSPGGSSPQQDIMFADELCDEDDQAFKDVKTSLCKTVSN